MKSVSEFLEQKLKLRVNRSKSAVALVQERKFLGYRLRAGGMLMIAEVLPGVKTLSHSCCRFFRMSHLRLIEMSHPRKKVIVPGQAKRRFRRQGWNCEMRKFLWGDEPLIDLK